MVYYVYSFCIYGYNILIAFNLTIAGKTLQIRLKIFLWYEFMQSNSWFNCLSYAYIFTTILVRCIEWDDSIRLHNFCVIIFIYLLHTINTHTTFCLRQKPTSVLISNLHHLNVDHLRFMVKVHSHGRMWHSPQKAEGA